MSDFLTRLAERAVGSGSLPVLEPLVRSWAVPERESGFVDSEVSFEVRRQARGLGLTRHGVAQSGLSAPAPITAPTTISREALHRDGVSMGTREGSDGSPAMVDIAVRPVAARGDIAISASAEGGPSASALGLTAQSPQRAATSAMPTHEAVATPPNETVTAHNEVAATRAHETNVARPDQNSAAPSNDVGLALANQTGATRPNGIDVEQPNHAGPALLNKIDAAQPNQSGAALPNALAVAPTDDRGVALSSPPGPAVPNPLGIALPHDGGVAPHTIGEASDAAISVHIGRVVVRPAAPPRTQAQGRAAQPSAQDPRMTLAQYLAARNATRSPR